MLTLRLAAPFFYHRLVRPVEKHSQHYLVNIRGFGRLGNQMFRFASSIGIARTLNYTLVGHSPESLLEYFNIPVTQACDKHITNVMSITEHQWRTKNWRANKQYRSYNLSLDGYFQSWQFFETAVDEVRKSLSIQSHFLDQAKKFLDKHIHDDNKTVVGIHVRRGDFLSDFAVRAGRVVVSAYYIEKAKKYFRKNYEDPVFVVISDDIKWCKDNIADNNTIFSSFEEPILDMALMFLCHHMIISIGTFSWWCGWFSQGTVIYMKDHPRPGSLLSMTPQYKQGFFLPHWIGMGNG